MPSVFVMRPASVTLPVFVSAGAITAPGTTSLTASFTGVAANDLLVFMDFSGEPLTVPSGWSTLRVDTASGQSGGVYYRVATSGDGGTPSWTWSNASGPYMSAVWCAYRGASSIAASAFNAASSGSPAFLNLVAPSLTAPDAGVLLTAHGTDSSTVDGAGAITSPGSMTRQATNLTVGATSVLDSEDITTAGATGTRTATQASRNFGVADYALLLIA